MLAHCHREVTLSHVAKLRDVTAPRGAVEWPFSGHPSTGGTRTAADALSALEITGGQSVGGGWTSS
jgi:hypothetical protein